MNAFRTWWENSDEAHKARHESEEACALAAWNAAMEEAALECQKTEWVNGAGGRPSGQYPRTGWQCAEAIRAHRA